MKDHSPASDAQPSADVATRAGDDSRAPASSSADRYVLRKIQAKLRDAPVRVTLWDGSTCYEGATPVATICIADRRSLWRVVRHQDVGLGDGFRDGGITLEGDLVGAVEAVFRVNRAHWTAARAARRQRPWWRSNTRGRAAANVGHHYDLGNDFYRLWLDRRMVYTCAYYATPEMTLDDAQVAKLDLVCRKLRLRPGERVVEAGSGWGALALHMARHYGVSVRSFNLSREQVAYARRWAREESLDDRVEFVQDDYRNVSGRYDAFVSVGMLEHVGPPHYEALGKVIDRCLPPDAGRGLLHFIGRDRPALLNAWIRKRVFPGAYPPTVSEVAEAVLEPWDLSILDVENLRLHYDRTCGDWLARFEAAEAQVIAMTGPDLYRTWRLYLAGSQAAFRTGWMQLFQIVFRRGGDNDLAWTRDALYQGGAAAEPA
ncbi:MAG: class I SAM-dependent methyltransferase [Acidobacteria bacterium]|nr:class I SAM-dependent methyltransferase [Acidobacteriota bacterium]